MKNKFWFWVAIILGLLLLYIGLVYLTHSAASLPHYYPGYNPIDMAKHTKHGVAAIILAILCFIFSWFQTGKKTTNTLPPQ